jgi:hypothetical protein
MSLGWGDGSLKVEGHRNRRDGAWQRPEPLPLAAEFKPLIGAALAFAILFLVHPYIAGVSPLPR